MATPRVVVVPVNEYGRRIGEAHHKARLSDATVDLLREMHEDQGLGYRRIAKAMQLSVGTVRKICGYQRRAQTPVRWKRIRIVIPVSN
jgi:DNA invertase Pin-like site-specific DNA recombinase